MNPLTFENLHIERDRLAAEVVRQEAEIEALKDAFRTVLGYAKLHPADALTRIENVARRALNGDWS